MEELLKQLQQFTEYLNVVILGYPLHKLAVALLIFLFFLFLRKLFLLLVVRSVRRLLAKTETTWDDKLFQALRSPVSFLFVILGAFFALKYLGIEQDALKKTVSVLFIFTFFWAVYNLVSVFEDAFIALGEKFGKEFSREIGSFLSKLVKFFVVSVGFIAILQELGINVSAFIASLGIGGLAVALAARDTVANFFGGLTILLDKTFKIGDWIKVGDVEGIVEDLGLRTTKIRTFEKSLVTVPNQILSTRPVENFSRRSVRRIKLTVGLTYDTPRPTIEKIVNEIRQMLKSHPRIAKDQLTMVYFNNFGDSALELFIYCFTDTANWEEYLKIRQDVLLNIMDIVERNGSSFAFPSLSVYVEKLPKEDKDRR
ncbi:MAG: mechanosensitive ion channel family protein [Aquificae bacterium]|nr:mechanosensitive ion channel family protein [Aquificota bacterium]